MVLAITQIRMMTNDGIPDESDDLPLDLNESVDTDSDGIGNNADTDDDNDGVSG